MALLEDSVRSAGWRIDSVSSVKDAKGALEGSRHDLMALDLGLPDGSGLDLVRELRSDGSALPVLIVTASGDVETSISGLDAGADDFLAKPFNHREFLARCRALERRSRGRASPRLSAGCLSFDPATGSLLCRGELVGLRPRERQLLEILMRSADHVVEKDCLETAMSEIHRAISTNTVELIVSRLRRKINQLPAAATIETVRGLGYVLRTWEV